MRISDKNMQPEVVIGPLEVKVFNSFEDAARRFKMLVSKEKVLTLYKQKMAYEKPSVKRKRKSLEARRRVILTGIREAQIASGEWEMKQKRKDERRAKKLEFIQEKND